MKKAVDDTTDDLDKFKSQANDKFQNLGNMGCQVSKGGIHAVSDYKKRCLSTTSGVS